MMGVGLSEMLILFLMMGGSSGADIASFVPPKHYFETMEVQTSHDKMIELASKEGKDGRAQLQQLLAIRFLTDDAEAFKKSAKYAEQRRVIEQIAAGKQANDPQGFAKEQALKALARFDGKTWTAPAAPVLREDALAWFPANATFGMAWDGRHTRNLLGSNSSNMVLDMLKMMNPPAEQKKIFQEIYSQVEKVGNVRLDRVAFAFVEDEKQPRQSKIFVRFTGKADVARMLDLLKTLERGLEVTEKKDDQGLPYTELQRPGRPPVFLAFGDSELIMTGFADDKSDHQVLVKEVLAARAKKLPGALKEAMAKVPAKACAFMVGTLPQDFRRDLQRELGDVPSKVQGSIEQLPTGFDINLEGTMAKGGDSRKLVEVVSKGRQQAIEGMKQLQNGGLLPPGFPALPYQAMYNVMESMQINGMGENVQMRMMVPNDVVQVLPISVGFFGMAVRPLAPPAAPPKVEVKKARDEEEKK